MLLKALRCQALAAVLLAWNHDFAGATTVPLRRGQSAPLVSNTNTVQLLGCAEIGCPSVEVNGTQEASCQVGDDKLVSLGVAAHAIQLPGTNTSLTLAIGRRERHSIEIETANSFYLGAPKGLSLIDNGRAFTGCALFVSSWGSTVGFKWPKGEMPRDVSCAASLGQDCLQSVLEQAKTYWEEAVLQTRAPDMNSDDTRGEACSTLATQLTRAVNGTDGTAAGCMFPSESIDIRGIPILGPGAPLPMPSPTEQRQSICKPMLPTEYELHKLGWDQHFAKAKTGSDTDGYTPVITVIYSTTERLAVSQLTCLRPVDEYVRVVPDFAAGSKPNQPTKAKGGSGALGNAPDNGANGKSSPKSNNASQTLSARVLPHWVLFLLIWPIVLVLQC